MAKNIKKRSASHIYFGVNKLTGELKHISEVPSGQKCNCICAACLQPFEARKGTRRRHHFAHVSNYECMYASEVAIYKAIAEALKQSGFLTLPPVMLRFPAWHDPELLQEARRLKIDSVAFECEPLSYPPLLRVTMQGTPLRILLDFDRYYDDDDSPLMFWCPRTNGYWSPDSLRHLHKQMLAAAGVDESVRFHDLRHTFSTLAIQSGVDAKTVAGMLGHYSAAFTLDTYTHVTEQMKRGAAEKIGIFMNANVNVQVNVVHSLSAAAHDVPGSDLANCLTPSISTDLDPT